MAVNQQCLTQEWRSSCRSARGDENMSRENEWMDVSKEEEDQEKAGKEEEQTEDDLQGDAQESDETDDEQCSVSFSIIPSNSGSVDAMFTNNGKGSNEVEYDNNNNVATCSNSFPVTNSGHLEDGVPNDRNDEYDEEEYTANSSAASTNNDCLLAACKNNEKASEEYCDSFPVAPASTDALTAECTNNNRAGDEEDADKYDDENNDEGRCNSSSVMSAKTVAAINNNSNGKASDEEDAKCKYVDINGNEESPKSSGNGLVGLCTHESNRTDIDDNKDENDEDEAAASISTTGISASEMDYSSEQELRDQELEEEEDDDNDDEYDGTDSFEDSDDEDVDVYPKKMYSYPAYPGMIFQTLENMMRHSVLTDLTLCTEDGHQIQVHSIVLAAVSCFIRTKLRQKHRKEQFMCLCLGPEVQSSALAAVVEFAYSGTIPNLNKDNLESVWSAAVSLEVLSILELCKEEEEIEEEKASGKKEERKRIPAEEHMSVTLQHIRQLWTQRLGCDVELEAEGRVFHAHRVILAASSDYFRGMFTSGMKESRQEFVSLLLVEAGKFEVLLHYGYSGALLLGWGCVFDLALTSLQLQFESVFKLCLRFLHQEIDANSCLDVASFAEAYGMTDLLVLANDFVLRNFQDVSVTPKFQDLPVEKLKKFLESDSLCVPSELPVFKAVMSWIEAFPRQRVKLARELMGTIQFPLMTFQEFKEVKSITSWPRMGAKKLYDSLLEEFCSSTSDVQSNFRAYMPKDTIVLVGGENLTDNLDKRRPCRDMWFSNSLQNHVGLVKKVEWRELGTLPEKPRFSHGVGTMRGKLYVVGGRHYYGKNDTMNCTYRYDPVQNSWQRLADMHEKRGSFTLVVLNGKIYAIGGERNSEVNMESVEVYCPNTNTWSFARPLNQPLCCHAASVWNGTIFLSGGFNSEYQCLSSMIRYHPEQGSTYLAEMRNNRSLHCMETLGDRLYVAGGVSRDADGLLLDQLACEVYDPLANSWSAIMPFQVPHVGSASAVLEGKVYIIGGYSHEDYSDTKSVHRYSPAAERWELMSVTPGPNTYIAACVLPIPPHLRH